MGHCLPEIIEGITVFGDTSPFSFTKGVQSESVTEPFTTKLKRNYAKLPSKLTLQIVAYYPTSPTHELNVVTDTLSSITFSSKSRFYL
jgi:hypothetical protein